MYHALVLGFESSAAAFPQAKASQTLLKALSYSGRAEN
jgi:hypothetical protein